ncbi:MAG: S8 family serine peptidase [Oligoflexia bacterium]|nr:S8 family serine peptidase [Oligoflexia bacterium]
MREQGLALVCALALFTGCGSAPETDGVLAQVDGRIEKLSEREAAALCGDGRFCEPNYVYSANFGRRRREPAPAPVPAPVPTATPTSAPRPTATPAPTSTAAPNLEREYAKQRMRVEEAWRLTTGSREIVVAVIDTGIDVTHPDLRENIWSNAAELKGVPGVDDDGNGYIDDVYGYDFHNERGNGLDDNRHGTHVAGIIGAALNGFGTAGVSSQVRLMPLKFLSATGSGDARNAIRAIDYAVANGARVISNSWGGGGRSELLEAAIARATARGIAVVAAAGNERNDNDSIPTYPAGYPGVISVASSNFDEYLSGFSNYGRGSVLLAAPGEEIWSTLPRGDYGMLSGTSMAAPQVSGALALALSLGRGIGAERLKGLLCETSSRILLSWVSCGRLDVAEFIRRVNQGG